MKKHICKTWTITAFLLIFFLCGVSAQNTEAVIYYKNGKSFSGYGRLIKNNKVQFKRTKKTKSLKVAFKLLDSVVIHTENGDYLFKEVKVENVKKPIVLEVLVMGKANLYGDTSYIVATDFGMSNSVYSTNKGGYNKNNKLIKITNNTTITTTNFLLQMPGDEVPKFLPLNNPLSSNFKKTTTEIFKDCPSLVEKIQIEEFKKRDMVEIVQYYNQYCN